MSYRQVLDDAIGDSPVSTVDIDAVITRQRRAGKLRRWAACGAGAAAVLAVTFTAAQVLPGNPRPGPADGPRITTVAGTPEDLARLDNAVLAAIDREVPGLTWRGSGSAGTPAWTHPGGYQNTLVDYYGEGAITVDGVDWLVMVRIERHGARRTSGWSCAEADRNCRESTGPHGERLWTRYSASPDESDDRRAWQSLEVLRPADDTLVGVTLRADSEPIAIPALTLEEQTAIALDPAIALAPAPPGQPTGGPTGPGPSAAAGPAQRRIDTAVFASLRRQAPAVKGENGDLAAVWTAAGGDNTADSYWGQGRIRVSGVAGLFSVQMQREDGDSAEDLTCGRPSRSYTCEAGTGPHGERYRTVTNTTRTGSATSATRDVSVARKDDSWLLVSLNADPPAGKFALTAEQQQAVAFDRTIALAGR